MSYSARYPAHRKRRQWPRRARGRTILALSIGVLGAGAGIFFTGGSAAHQRTGHPVTGARAELSPPPSAVAPVTTAPLPLPSSVPATTAAPTPPPCPAYSTTSYGIDPNEVSDTGGGTQLVTVVDPTTASRSGIFVAWTKETDGCWVPVSFAGVPPQPYEAQTGYGGLLPISQRVPGDYATPIGLFPFGSTVYGNSTLSPTDLYPYRHLVCGDWWDEQPGSPTYDTFQHVPCGDSPPYAEDSEALWTETEPYQHFIDIMMPHPPDNGAGIFLHDDTTEGYTEGCVALPPAELDAVLGWLNPAYEPHALIAVS